MIKLSKRLKTVASFVPKGSNVADIGTDHGYVPIYLVETGISDRGIAMDVRRGPLERAACHIREAGLESRIETRLSDGLTGLGPGEADCVVIAGMGGELMIRILWEGRRLWDSVSRWVLSPHSEIEKVRGFLREQSFSIVRESMIKEDGKFYTIMGAERILSESLGKSTEIEDRYGRLLMDQSAPVLKEYLEDEHKKLSKIIRELSLPEAGALAGKRREELLLRLRQNEEAQDEMQRNY